MPFRFISPPSGRRLYLDDPRAGLSSPQVVPPGRTGKRERIRSRRSGYPSAERVMDFARPRGGFVMNVRAKFVAAVVGASTAFTLFPAGPAAADEPPGGGGDQTEGAIHSP